MRLVALLAACALAASPARAGDTTALDGERATRHTYAGLITGEIVLDERMVPASSEPPPQAVECRESSCDATLFQLRLPAGRQTGKLVVAARFSDYLTGQVAHRNVHVVLYDRANRVVADATPAQPDARPRLPADPNRHLESRYATVVLTASRLPAGIYFVRLFNHGLPMNFEATVTWTANAPTRHR